MRVLGQRGVARHSTDRIFHGRRLQQPLKSRGSNLSSSSPRKDDVPHAIPKSFAIGGTAGILGSLAGMGGGFVMM